jgi:hypothetical protein
MVVGVLRQIDATLVGSGSLHNARTELVRSRRQKAMRSALAADYTDYAVSAEATTPST